MLPGEKGFCLLHKLQSGIDTGPIVKYKEFFYPPNCRIPKEYRQFYEKQNESFLHLVSSVIVSR